MMASLKKLLGERGMRVFCDAPFIPSLFVFRCSFFLGLSETARIHCVPGSATFASGGRGVWSENESSIDVTSVRAKLAEKAHPGRAHRLDALARAGSNNQPYCFWVVQFTIPGASHLAPYRLEES
jgi:hypothetical protein